MILFIFLTSFLLYSQLLAPRKMLQNLPYMQFIFNFSFSVSQIFFYFSKKANIIFFKTRIILNPLILSQCVIVVVSWLLKTKEIIRYRHHSSVFSLLLHYTQWAKISQAKSSKVEQSCAKSNKVKQSRAKSSKA